MNEPWELPSHWRWAQWKSVAKVASHLVSPQSYPELPHIAPNHIEAQTGRVLPYSTVHEDGVTSAKHLFRPGQVLYSKIRPYLAKAVVVDFEGLCSADMYPVDTELEARFLKWWMLTPEFTRRASGEQARTVLPKINKHALGQLPVPVPPRHEQQRIVAILEDHLSRLDAGDASLVSAGRRLDALLRSTLEAHFGLNGPGVPLRDLVEGIGAGKSFGGANAPAADGEWGIIKVSAMTWGEFRPEENKAVLPDRVDPRYEIREGDLLVSRANTSDYVGASVLVGPVRPRLLLSDKSLRVTPRAGVATEWLWRTLQAPSTRRQISRLATGTKDSMRNISQSALLAVRVRDPRNIDADSALDAFAAVADSVADARLSVNRQGLRSSALRSSLLAAAFRGELSRDLRKDVEFV